MTDNDKLNFIQSVFRRYISQIETLAQFKTFIGNITPAKVRNAIKAELQKDIDSCSGEITNKQEKVSNLTTFKDEINNL